MENNEPLRQKRAAVDSEAVAEGASSVGEFHLLAVGIDQYEDAKWSRLNSPLNDVAAMCAILELRYGFKRNNIEVIPSKIATKNEIFSKLLEYSSADTANEDTEKVLSEDDSLVIWLAGHGQEHTGTGRSFFIPRNGPVDFCAQTWLDYGLFGDVLKGIKARHILLVSDSCFSAGIFAERGESDGNITSPEYAKYHMQYKSRRAITSGAHIDTVSDDGFDGYSIFTYTALEVLRTNRRTHLSSKGFCTLIENTIDESFSQYPREGELRSVIRNGGQFAFVLNQHSGDFEASKQYYLELASTEIIPKTKTSTTAEVTDKAPEVRTFELGDYGKFDQILSDELEGEVKKNKSGNEIDFFDLSIPVWEDILLNKDIRRDIQNEILEIIANQTGLSSFIPIVSASCDGKSTILKRLAFECSKFGYEVYFNEQYASSLNHKNNVHEIDFDNIDSSEKILLFIDDYQRGDIDELIQLVESSKENIHVIATIQDRYFDNSVMSYRQSVSKDGQPFTLDGLSLEEFNRYKEKLLGFVDDQAMKRLTEIDSFFSFADLSSLVLQNSKLLPRFKLLLNQLNKDALSRELIKYVSISYYYSQPLPLVSLLSLLRGDGFEISEEQLLDHANSKLDGEIIISELDEDTVFRLRHETIASAFLQNMKISSARKSELLMHMLVHMIEQGQASFASKLLNTALINISSADFIKLLERRGTKKFIVVAVNSSYPNLLGSIFECLLKNIDDETLKKKVLKKRVLDLDAVSTKRGDSDVSFLVAKLFMDEVRSNITNSELDTVALTKSLIGPTNVRYMSNEHNLLVLLNAVTGVHAVSIGTLTRFLLHTGKVDVALKVWELISQNNNEFVHTYISILNLGAVYLEVGDLKSASLLYQQHLELTRSSQKLWRRYIEVLIKQNFDAAHSEISLFEAKHGAPAKYLFLELYIRFKQVKEISEIRNHIIKNPGGGVTQKVWLLASSLCLNESKIEDIYIFIWDVLIRLKSFNQRSETNVNFIRTALKCCICPEDKQNIVTLGLINYLSDWGENQAVENEAKVFQEIDIFLTGIWTEISLGNKLSNELFHFLIAVKSLNMKSHKLQKLSELISQSSSLMDTSFEKIHPLNLFPIACICFHIGSMELSNSFFSAASRAVKTSPSFYYEWASLCKKAGFSYAEQKYLLAIDAEKLQTPKSIEGLTAFMMEHGDRRDFEKAMEILLVNQA